MSTPQNPPPTAPDPRPLLWRAIDQVDTLLTQTTPADLDRPTPASDWTVRDLVGHLVAVERRIAHIAAGGQPYEVSSMVTDVADDGWLAAWRDARGPLTEALADDAVLDRTFAHPARPMPGRQAIFAYVNEMAVHGWDLAAALGHGTDELDPELAAATIDPIMAFLPAEPRGGPIPFGPVVEVPADAPVYDRLLGWLGRDPSWSATTAG